MKDLFGNTIREPRVEIRHGKAVKITPSVNPMIKMHGPYKDIYTKCKDCAFLYFKQYKRRYYKCLLRPDNNDNNPKSDHRKHWYACSKFSNRDNNQI